VVPPIAKLTSLMIALASFIQPSPMRFVITSGTGIREIVDERPDATSAYQRVMDLVSTRRPNVRIFDQDGQSVSLQKLRRLSDAESVKRP
jgi:hypothetical protein